MKTFILIILCLFATSAFAADYYIDDTGGGDGHSCGSPFKYDWDWTTTHSVADGDTVWICGTVTHQINIPKGGTSTAITLKFSDGAKLSSTNGPYNGFIRCASKDNIIIDGGTNGIIENTDNGDHLTYDTDTNAIQIVTCNYIEVKNLTVQNIFIAISGHDTELGAGIVITDGTNIQIHDNVVHDAFLGIYMNVQATDMSVMKVYDNTVSACKDAIGLSVGGTNRNANDIQVYNNSITMGTNWFPVDGARRHLNGWHSSVVGGGGSITNLKFYSNSIIGDPGNNATSFFYSENENISPQIYNNLFVNTNTGDYSPGNGMVVVGNTAAANSPKVYNNTIVGNGYGNGLNMPGKEGDTLSVYNNIFKSLAVGYAIVTLTPPVSIYHFDNNLYYDNTYVGWYGGGGHSTLAAWQALLAGGESDCPSGTGHECNSISGSDPLFTSSSVYTLQSGSPAKWTGTATGQLSAADKLGIAWHSPPSIGAYEWFQTGNINGAVISGAVVK